MAAILMVQPCSNIPGGLIPKRLTESDKRLISALRKEGASFKLLGRAFCRSEAAVCDAAAFNGIPPGREDVETMLGRCIELRAEAAEELRRLDVQSRHWLRMLLASSRVIARLST